MKDYEKPLPKLKELSESIKNGEAANTANNKSLAVKRAELKRLGTIHSYLFYLNKEHEPPPPQRQPQQKKRSYDHNR